MRRRHPLRRPGLARLVALVLAAAAAVAAAVAVAGRDGGADGDVQVLPDPAGVPAEERSRCETPGTDADDAACKAAGVSRDERRLGPQPGRAGAQAGAAAPSTAPRPSSPATKSQDRLEAAAPTGAGGR